MKKKSKRALEIVRTLDSQAQERGRLSTEPDLSPTSEKSIERENFEAIAFHQLTHNNFPLYYEVVKSIMGSKHG